MEVLILEMKALIARLPSNAGFRETEAKNLFRIIEVHLESFAKSRLLFIEHQREGLRGIADRQCDMVTTPDARQG